MKIAILYICTGKYHIFFEPFYRSCEKYFLPEAKKDYYVFSDHEELADYNHVVFTYKECEGFPKDSLFRFRIFLTREKDLKQYDYIFFFNSNMEFINPVGDEILPQESDGNLCCLDADYHRHYPHPSFYPYERNKQSTAYVPRGRYQYRYYHGAVNGGKAKEYLTMCKTLDENISKDLDNGIVARYHDESHLNKYFFSHKCLGLHGEFGMPEGINYRGKVKLIIVDKTRYDKYFTKGRKSGLLGKIIRIKDLMINIISWYL